VSVDLSGVEMVDTMIGRHTVRFFAPDLIRIVYDGDVSRDEARGMSELYSEMSYGKDNYTIDLGFIGASMRTKVLMAVVVAAAITSNVKVRTHYFKTVEEGLAWAKVE
jgi:hypothetical protein